MKILVIGGNRFVGLRLVHKLDAIKGLEVHVLNRTGQVAHSRNAVVHKSDRGNLALAQIDRDWDLIYDFACFSRREAESTLNYFGKVGHYIFISTVSIYDFGAGLKECAFEPSAWTLTAALPVDSDPGLMYQHGKRQAEAVFTQMARFPVLSVRLPVILGPDDYTRRLEFHIDRTKAGEPIYASNPNALFSMVSAEDAADFLLWAKETRPSGPLNVASPEPTSLKNLCAQIELILGVRPNVQTPPPGLEEGFSPYSPDQDKFINVERMQKLGFKTRGITEWLPELIGLPITEGQKGRVH